MDKIISVVIGGIMLVATPFIGSKTSINEISQNISSQQKVVEYEIQSGDTFTKVLGSFDIPYDQAMTILTSSKDVFDFTRIQTGKVLKFIFIKEALASVEYPISSDETVVVEKKEDIFEAVTKPIEYDISIVTAKGVITDSLFLTAQEVGVPDKATLELADIFSSDIDFATDIREGDFFSLVYEKRNLDGKPAGAGKVLAAKFTNDGTTHTAFRYKDKFYTENGESLARQFLKSPLNYAQISSGYSYSRENPVTKQVTAHRAIDYAAQKGTPVIATADGKVVTSGSKGGLGITVELKHGEYLTQYAHLSDIAKSIKGGANVTQGDIIGYVGSTGISTGPHLQYAMFKNGTPINPLTSEFKREGSLSDFENESFIIVVNKFKNLLK